jgi:cobalt-zinc-cadmium efflux system membrane fusion protein
MSLKNLFAIGLMVCLGAALPGCSKTAEKQPAAVAKTGDEASEHDEWWCNEHGVPEEVCALCDNKLVAGFKAKGDWCSMHDRPDSQCFTCHPEKRAEFAAQYEAKFGKQPPKPTDNG